MDPLAGSTWSAPSTVAGFTQSAPNAVLMAFAEVELKRPEGARALDIGCGAGRNALPLARMGWSVVGNDLSWPMRDRRFDFVVAYGIWNLARTAAQFRNG